MSISVKVYNQKGEQAGDIKVSEHIFGIEKNLDLVHQAMVAQMGNERQVLAHTKDRSEVRGGGKKPWKQKGTGRARAGSSRSPIWIGGGITFGPRKDRNFSKDINKKMKRKALFMVLSDKLSENNMAVLEKVELAEFKTKAFNEILTSIEEKALTKKDEKKSKRSVLFINTSSDEKIKKSGSNLEGVNVICLDNINILDLLKYKNLIITDEAVKRLEEVYKK